MKPEFIRLWQRLAARVKRYDETHNFTCDVCGREVFSNERVCSECLKTLPWNRGEVCPFCGRKIGEAGVCLDCKEKRIGVEKARSCFTHEGEASRLVVRFKRGKKYLYRTLAELALPLLNAEFSEADALTYVPMTARAEKKRGYNQSRLLAEELARLVGKECLSCTEKQRETSAQKQLGLREREKNLQGCFRVTERAAVKDKKILIVDDTLTTGATSSELASVLRRAGAASVSLLTVTSVQKKYPFGKPPRDSVTE